MKTEVTLITPDLARQWLTHNTKNRPKKVGKVELYARDMAAGNWRVTGEAIKFGSSGRLLDGQNRLYAVIKSETTIESLVVWDIEDEDMAQELMDTGAARTPGDSLDLAGYRNAIKLAATVAVHKPYKEGGFRNCVSQLPRYIKPSHAETIKYVEQHPGLADVTNLGQQIRKTIRLPIGAINTVIYESRLIDPDDSDLFFTNLIEMKTTGNGDPLVALIKRCQSFGPRERPLASTGLYLLIRAWNAFRADESLTVIKLRGNSGGYAALPDMK